MHDPGEIPLEFALLGLPVYLLLGGHQKFDLLLYFPLDEDQSIHHPEVVLAVLPEPPVLRVLQAHTVQGVSARGLLAAILLCVQYPLCIVAGTALIAARCMLDELIGPEGLQAQLAVDASSHYVGG